MGLIRKVMLAAAATTALVAGCSKSGGDNVAACPKGSDGCDCYGNRTCDAELICGANDKCTESGNAGGSSGSAGASGAPGTDAGTGGTTASTSAGGGSGGTGGAAGAGAVNGGSAGSGGSAAGGQGGVGGAATNGGTTGGTTTGGVTTGLAGDCVPRLGGLPEIAPAGDGAMGDFNGDGVLDLVFRPGPFDGTAVRVLLGLGNGLYGAARTYDTEYTPTAVAVGDLDGDDVLDIAARNADGNVSIMKGAGDGSFELDEVLDAGDDSGSGFPKWNIVLADVSGDGLLDVLTGHWDGSIVVSVATAAGSFITLSPIDLGRGVTQLAVGDLNGDGQTDIVAGSGYTNVVSVLLATGGGTFAAQVDYPVASADSWLAQPLAVGDVDGDGNADVVSGNAAGAAVAVLKNSGNGTLSVGTPDNISGAAEYINNVFLHDLEGDGDLDLLANVDGDGALYYAWNNGSGQFPTRTRDYVANAAQDIRVGDVNGDGVDDLFLFGTKFLTLLGQGGGKFESQRYLLGDGSPVSITVGDFDGVGVLDVAVLNEATDAVNVFLLDENANYGVPTNYTVGDVPSFVRAGDVTGDNIDDLLALSYQGGTINVLRNDGDGSFTVLSPMNVIGFERWFDLQDVNEDGALDIVMLASTSGCVYLGTGTGAFGACSSFTASTGSARELMAIGDVNGDDHLDFVTAGNTSVDVRLGEGDGTIAESTAFYTSSAPVYLSRIALGDLNEDGILDLMLLASDSTSFSSTSVRVWQGVGDGSFTVSTDNTVQLSLGWSQAAELADINRDGHLDVLVASGGSNALVLVPGTGDGGLASDWFSYPAGENPLDLAVADLNGDGWLDAVTPGFDSGSAGVLFGGEPVCPAE